MSELQASRCYIFSTLRYHLITKPDDFCTWGLSARTQKSRRFAFQSLVNRGILAQVDEYPGEYLPIRLDIGLLA